MRRKRLFGVLIVAGLGLASPALAEMSPAVCLNAGAQYKAGEYACIPACHGQRRLARCDVNAQRASWTYVSDACPSALLPPSPSDTNMIPVVVAMTPIPLAIERRLSEMSSEAWMRFSDLRKQYAAIH